MVSICNSGTGRIKLQKAILYCLYISPLPILTLKMFALTDILSFEGDKIKILKPVWAVIAENLVKFLVLVSLVFAGMQFTLVLLNACLLLNAQLYQDEILTVPR